VVHQGKIAASEKVIEFPSKKARVK
jgi:hypothetical protein